MGWYKHTMVRHMAVMAISFAVVTIFVFFTLNISFLNPIATAFEDFSITDIYYQMYDNMKDVRNSNLITIVDMTELTSRRDIARTISEIERHEPKVLGIDMVFEGIKEDTIGDNMLMDIAEEYHNTVYSYKLLKYRDGQYTEEIHSFFTPFIPVNEGFTNFERKLYGGIKREVTIGQASQGNVKSSFSLTTANMYAGQDVMPLEDKQMRINFTPFNFNEISFREIDKHSELINNRIVLLGATKDEYDMHYTPLGKIAGVELLAYSIETILHHKDVRDIPTWLLTIITVMIVLLTELIQDKYEKIVQRCPIKSIRFLLSATMTLTVLTFMLMAIFFVISYMIFIIWHYSINLGWAYSAMAFLHSSRQFYDICTKKV